MIIGYLDPWGLDPRGMSSVRPSMKTHANLGGRLAAKLGRRTAGRFPASCRGNYLVAEYTFSFIVGNIIQKV